MPSIPKPRRLQVLHGNPSKRPLRHEPPVPLTDIFDETPTFDGLPELAKESAQRVWRRLVPLMREGFMLADTDYEALEVFCATYGRWLDAQRLGDARAERWARLDLLAFSAKLGLNPADRLRLHVPSREPEFSSVLD